MTFFANQGIHSDPKSLAAFGSGDARRYINWCMYKLDKKQFWYFVSINAVLIILFAFALIALWNPPVPSADQIDQVKLQLESYENTKHINKKPSFIVKLYKSWESGTELIAQLYTVIRWISITIILLSILQLIILFKAFKKKKI